jgi:NAD(P)H-hydrate epimerase
MFTLTRDQARRLDQRATADFGVPSIVLMENAGRGTTDVLLQLGASSPVVICCGKGNNAGDGFVIARHLDLRGVDTHILLWTDPESLKGDAKINFEISQCAGIPTIQCTSDSQAEIEDALGQATWIVDALLGTGIEGAPRSPLDAAIAMMNRAAAPILAVDLPSGFDCDTGTCTGAAIQAAYTCTFVAAKPGFLVDGAELFTGQLHVLDIGAPRKLVEQMIAEGEGG